MRAVFLALGIAAVLVAGLLACNGVLGIDRASLETDASEAAGDASVAAADFVAKDDCTDYCNDMAISCPALTANQEYLSGDVCQQFCKFHTDHYDEQGLGGPVDVSPTSALAGGDTLYCRVWHSHAALDNPNEHCPHAGPVGGDLCGTNPCDDFCAATMKFCGTLSYASMSDCTQACNADGGYPGFPYLQGDASDLQTNGGNTLNCRIYHLENFLNTMDPVHCAHIAADGGGVCVN
jgi:hypothetical protein